MAFTELVAARGDLNTQDNLTATTLFNKAFIANGSIKRVIDFQNVKVSYNVLSSTYYGSWTATAATATTITVSGQAEVYDDDAMNGMYLYVISGTGEGEFAYISDYDGDEAIFTFAGLSGGTTPDTTTVFRVYRKQLPLNGDLLTGQTSGAQVTVDFITKAAGPGEMYCTKLDDTPLVSGELLTGSNTAYWNSSLGEISFYITSEETEPDPPHWYEWTAYGDDKYVFGELPESCYLVAQYQARLWIAGSPDYPNQWWCSKSTNPWMYAYEVNDDLSANFGLAGSLGQAGDLVRALIPFKEDRLLLGCANGIKAIVGNPSSGGEMVDMEMVRGIWGANSWCYDGANSLYYVSSAGGLCKMNMILYTSESLTGLILPQLLGDCNPATHRILLAYDPMRQGVLMTITDLEAATSEAYFYSLKTTGMFPQTVPDECTTYSMVSFAANDPDQRCVLFGSRDGYIRRLSDTAKSDDVGSTDQAIDAHVCLPVMALGPADEEGRLRSLTLSTGGGDTGGTYSDSDSVTASLYSGDDAEDVAEKIRDGDTPDVTGAVTGVGRHLRFRSRLRGLFAGLKLSNSTADSTFSINKVLAEVEGEEK